VARRLLRERRDLLREAGHGLADVGEDFSRSASFRSGRRSARRSKVSTGSAKHAVSVSARTSAERGVRVRAASSPKLMPGERVESRTSEPFGSSVTTLTSPLVRK